MNTRQIELIGISQQEFEQEFSRIITETVIKQIGVMKSALADIRGFTEELLDREQWIYMQNRKVYYNNAIKAVFPDFEQFVFGHCSINKGFAEDTFNNEFADFQGDLMTQEEFRSAVIENGDWFRRMFPVPVEEIYFSVDDTQYCYNINGLEKKWGSFSREEAYHIPVFRIHKKDTKDLSTLQILYLWMRKKLAPQALPDGLVSAYEGIVRLLSASREYFKFERDLIEFNVDKIVRDIMEGKLKRLGDQDINTEEIKKDMEKRMNLSSLSESGSREFIIRLLNCDMVRCDIESYDEKILSDPNRGHWDLWDEPKDSAKYTVKLENGMIARNPIADINYDGVIGIDFGTKSTVVVYQENTEHTLPMRIGTGQISKKVEARHYENPTVMELLDLDHFLNIYYQTEGRPETRWEDLVISHTANSSMLNSSSTDYYSFFNEFKQWAGDKRRQIRLKDKQNKDILLPPFSEIEEGFFNPIEIYAYYIGLYINNMNNGIYLDYIMSFPVTYENSVRKKITESFEQGIKKSFPRVVLEDENAMKRFRVSSSISEPAAYAICALEQCYSDLGEDERIYYGIFDFGGGTTDFDYGVWREADGNERKYDYVLECFGAGGDQFLGGENLLELLAFEVFKDNQEILRNERISFVLPPECKKFPGSEMLLSESQEAKLNMRQLMESLRPYWEEQEGYENLFQEGIVKVTLFSKEGEARINFELSVAPSRLDAILRGRISKGVVNFFEGLKAAFELPSGGSVQRIDIFLAGNSSRSGLVTALFQDYIDYYTRITAEEEDNGPVEAFIVHPPLGFQTEEWKGREGDEDNASSDNEEDLSYLTRPTGKTGVAFGLIEGRPGGRIKVLLPDLPIDSEGKQSEIKFKYFVGYKKKTCFRIVSDRNVPYGEWVELCDASAQDFTIYYTSLPEALTNMMSILDVSKKNCRLFEPHEDSNIYYRPVSPTAIEYVVARPGEMEKGEYTEDIVYLELA